MEIAMASSALTSAKQRVVFAKLSFGGAAYKVRVIAISPHTQPEDIIEHLQRQYLGSSNPMFVVLQARFIAAAEAVEGRPN